MHAIRSDALHIVAIPRGQGADSRQERSDRGFAVQNQGPNSTRVNTRLIAQVPDAPYIHLRVFFVAVGRRLLEVANLFDCFCVL